MHASLYQLERIRYTISCEMFPSYYRIIYECFGGSVNTGFATRAPSPWPTNGAVHESVITTRGGEVAAGKWLRLRAVCPVILLMIYWPEASKQQRSSAFYSSLARRARDLVKIPLAAFAWA